MKNLKTKKLFYILILSILSLNVFTQTSINIESYKKISSLYGYFSGVLTDNDYFGRSIASIGDINNDGNPDFAVSASGDNNMSGAVYIITTNTDNSVKSYYKICTSSTDFIGQINSNDNFGSAVACIGDLNYDGINDIAVGARFNNSLIGSIYIIFLKSDGSVKSFQKITNGMGGLPFTLTGGYFGSNIIAIGDLNKDGIIDIAVNADQALNNNGNMTGVVYILFLNKNGTVKNAQKIDDTNGGFSETITYGDYFGYGLSLYEDIDGDENIELLVGSGNNDIGGTNRGCFHILYLNSNGTVKKISRIDSLNPFLNNTINDNDKFGVDMTNMGDIDGDGISDIAVSAPYDQNIPGKFYFITMNADGSLKSSNIIGKNQGNFNGILDNYDKFGFGMTSYVDPKEPNKKKIVVGAIGDDDGGTDRGAIWFFDIYASLQVNFTYQSGCLKSPIQFTYTGYSNYDSLLWNFGDINSNLDTSTRKSPIYSYTNSGTYTVNLDMYYKNIKYSKSLPVTILAPPSAGIISGKPEVCINQNSVGYSIPLINNATTYTWEYSGTGASIIGSSNNISINFSQNATNGNLTVYGSNSCGNGIKSVEFPINISPQPSNASKIIGPQEVCANQGYVIYSIPLITNTTNYIWNYTGNGTTIFGNKDSINLYFFNNATSGNLSVYGKNSCGNGAISENFPIIIKSCSENPANKINIPNAFTPNGDGINDLFIIRGLINNTTVMIFDRLGKKVYESKNYLNDWDGKNMNADILETDTYWYIISVPGIPKEFKGFVYLKK